MFFTLLLCAAAQTPITVLYFDNNSGDATYNALGKGLADMMVTDLSKVPSLRVVEREKIEAILKEMKLQRGKYFDPKTAQALGKGVGAQLAVTGAFVAIDPDLRIDVRVVKIATGEVIETARVVGKKIAFFALQEQLSKALGMQLAKALGETVSIPVTKSTDKLASARAYGAGLDRKDNGDLKGAGDELEQLVAGDPNFALAKQRYMEIMRELYAAKGLRSGALAEVERELLEGLIPGSDRYLDPNEPDNDTIYGGEPRTLVRADIYLKRVAVGLESTTKGSALLSDLKLWVNVVERLIETLDDRDKRGKTKIRRIHYQCPYDGAICLDQDERDKMAQLGLTVPLEQRQRTMVHQLALDLANLMMHGEAPVLAGWQMPRRMCFSKLDKRFPAHAFALYDFAERTLTEYLFDFYEYWHKDVPNQGATIVQWRAKSFVRLGKIEEAIAALQAGMRKYPTAKEFSVMERLVRDLLSGKSVLQKCEDPT